MFCGTAAGGCAEGAVANGSSGAGSDANRAINWPVGISYRACAQSLIVRNCWRCWKPQKEMPPRIARISSQKTGVPRFRLRFAWAGPAAFSRLAASAGSSGGRISSRATSPSGSSSRSRVAMRSGALASSPGAGSSAVGDRASGPLSLPKSSASAPIGPRELPGAFWAARSGASPNNALARSSSKAGLVAEAKGSSGEPPRPALGFDRPASGATPESIGVTESTNSGSLAGWGGVSGSAGAGVSTNRGSLAGAGDASASVGVGVSTNNGSFAGGGDASVSAGAGVSTNRGSFAGGGDASASVGLGASTNNGSLAGCSGSVGAVVSANRGSLAA